MVKPTLEVGVVGAGMGGLMASIAIARAGGKVTLLEAASQLGEIGAGIQMVSLPSSHHKISSHKIIDAERIKASDEIRRGQSHWRQSRSIQGT